MNAALSNLAGGWDKIVIKHGSPLHIALQTLQVAAFQ